MEAAKRNEMAMVSLLEASEKSFEVQGHHHGGRSSFNLAELNILADSLKSVSWTRLLGLFGGLTRSAFWLALSQSGNTIINTLGFYIASQTGDVKVQSAFGLTIFFTIVSILSIVEPISEKIGVSCALSSGAGNYEATKANFLRGVVMFVFYVGLIFVPIILYSEEIYKMLGFEPETSLLCSQIQTKLFPMDLMRLTGSILLTYLISQGIETSFGLYVMANLVCGLAISYFLGIYHEMGLNGWMIGRLWFDMASLALYLHGYFKRLPEKARGLVSIKEVFSGIGEYFTDVLKFTVSYYSEILGWELPAFITTLTKDNYQIAAHTSLVNLGYLIYNFGLGFAVASRTRINFLLGKGEPTTAKNYFIMVLVGMFCVSLLLGLGVHSFKTTLATVYASENKEVSEWFVRLLNLYGYVLPADFLLAFVFTVGRSTGLSILVTFLNIGLLWVAQGWMSGYVIGRLQGTCLEVLWIQYFLGLLVISCLVWKTLELDWSLLYKSTQRSGSITSCQMFELEILQPDEEVNPQ